MDNEFCGEKTELELKEMLGPAFNGRYMSVEVPIEEAPVIEPTNDSSGMLS